MVLLNQFEPGNAPVSVPFLTDILWRFLIDLHQPNIMKISLSQKSPKKQYSRVDLPSRELMTLSWLDIVKRELSLQRSKSSLGALASLNIFQIEETGNISFKEAKKHFFKTVRMLCLSLTWMDRCS